MSPRPALVVLCAILMTSLMTSFPVKAAPRGVISSSELGPAIASLSRIFMAGKQRAVNFTLHSAGALMESLERLPIALDETHESLKSARNKAFSIREESEGYIIDTAERLGELNNRLFNMVKSCPQNLYVCTECDSIDLIVPSYDTSEQSEIKLLDPPTPPEMNVDLSDLETAVTSLLQPVEGVSEVIEELIRQYGDDTQVNLQDLINIVHQIGREIDEKRIAVLKGQVAAMKDAAALLKNAYKHAHGIYTDAAWLEWAVSNNDESLGETLAHDMKTFGSFLSQLECVA